MRRRAPSAADSASARVVPRSAGADHSPGGAHPDPAWKPSVFPKYRAGQAGDTCPTMPRKPSGAQAERPMNSPSMWGLDARSAQLPGLTLPP